MLLGKIAGVVVDFLLLGAQQFELGHGGNAVGRLHAALLFSLGPLASLVFFITGLFLWLLGNRFFGFQGIEQVVQTAAGLTLTPEHRLIMPVLRGELLLFEGLQAPRSLRGLFFHA